MLLHFLLTILLPLGGLTGLHDFHVSVTELDWDSQTGEMTVAVHIFIDDLEAGLKKSGAGDSLFVGTKFERPDVDDWIDRYVHERLQIAADGEEVELEWYGKELSDDLQAVWVYLASPEKIPAIRRFDFRYDLLMDVYDDQKNLMNIRIDHQQETSLLFSGRKTRVSYELE